MGVSAGTPDVVYFAIRHFDIDVATHGPVFIRHEFLIFFLIGNAYDLTILVALGCGSIFFENSVYAVKFLAAMTAINIAHCAAIDGDVDVTRILGCHEIAAAR